LIRKRHLGLTLILIALCFPGSGAARGSGKLKISPHFDLELDHYDNLAFSSQSEVGDSYALIIPGIAVEIPNRWMKIKADYSYWRYQYRDSTELNRGFHDASLEIDDNISLLKNTTISLGDNYEIVPVNAFLPSDMATNQVQKNEIYLNPAWEKKFSRSNALKIDYRFSRSDYFGRGSRYGENYFEHEFTGAARNLVSPWLDFPLRLIYLIRDYDDLPDYSQFHPEAGIGVSPYKYLTFVGRVGYYFENDDQQGGNNISYHLEGKYKKYRNWARISYDRSRNFDIEGNPYYEDHSEFRYYYWLGKKLDFNGYLRYHHYTDVHPASERWEIRFAVNYRITSRSHLEAGYVRYRSRNLPPEMGTAVSNRFYSRVGISF
jgi:hypothetical protein